MHKCKCYLKNTVIVCVAIAAAGPKEMTTRCINISNKYLPSSSLSEIMSFIQFLFRTTNWNDNNVEIQKAFQSLHQLQPKMVQKWKTLLFLNCCTVSADFGGTGPSKSIPVEKRVVPSARMDVLHCSKPYSCTLEQEYPSYQLLVALFISWHQYLKKPICF